MTINRRPSTTVRVLVLLGAIAVAAAGAATLPRAALAQSARLPDDPRSGALPRTIPVARLEALAPTRPEDYFELAEDVADVAATDDERRLARELFALAGVLDPDRFGPGAALSLYELARSEAERRRLLALARRLEAARPGGPLRPAALGEQAAPEAAAAVSAALALRRLGDGRAALLRLEQAEGALPLAERTLAELPGGFDGFVRACERLGGDGAAVPMSREARLMELRVERRMLAGETTAVVEDLLLQQGRPLIEIDLDRLDIELGMDRGRAWWRNGRWTGRPGAARR